MKEKLTMIELFSGIGAQKEGINLTELFDCQVIATSDIEKDAMLDYAAIHEGLTMDSIKDYDFPSDEDMRNELMKKNIGYDFQKGNHTIKKVSGDRLKLYYLAMKKSNNLGDISKIETLQQVDFWTYSFPCTDISVAGKQEGIIKGKTRSGLLYEVERLLEVADKYNTKPKFLLLENVKNLVGKQFKQQFDEWIEKLDELGYNTYWKVVNGKNCGVPQSRERCFAISIRKDIDTKQFNFMNDFDNGLRLKDLLEETVDDKYYLSEEIQNRLVITDDTFSKNIVGTTKPEFRTIGQRDLVYQQDSIMGALVATDYKQPKQILEVNTVKIKQATKQGYIECKIGGVADLSYPNNTTRRGRVQDGGDTCPTITATETGIHKIETPYRVRKLTPKECWRLMGFSDECFSKAEAIGTSDTQLYKQAGNSIITYCIKGIMEHLYKAQYDSSYICSDETIFNSELEITNLVQAKAV